MNENGIYVYFNTDFSQVKYLAHEILPKFTISVTFKKLLCSY